MLCIVPNEIQTIDCSSDTLGDGQVTIEYSLSSLVYPYLKMQKLLVR